MKVFRPREVPIAKVAPRVSSTSPRLYTIVAFAFSAVVLLVAFTFVEPPPPDHLRIAAGSPGGAYYDFAEQYRDILQAEKVTLEVVETAGSVENLQLLQSDEEPVDIAILQGGILTTDPGGISALAGVFVEPLWVFYRGEERFERLSDLRGRRLAVGPDGSGTRVLALSLLESNGITAATTDLQSLSSRDAVRALRDGKVDAAFFVANASAAVVQDLVTAPEIRLMSLSRAEAYSQRDHNIARVVLHEGAIDLLRGIPSQDTELLAPTASIVAREDIHPAIVSLLLQTLEEVHRDGGLFEPAGAFPAPERVPIPGNEVALRFFESGPPFLQRVLPFWIASLIDRMLVLIIPLLTLIVPLARVLPPVYRWRMRGRINRLYAALARLEAQFETRGIDREAAAAELNRLEDEAGDIELPASYVAEISALRFYLGHVRSVIMEDQARQDPGDGPPGER